MGKGVGEEEGAGAGAGEGEKFNIMAPACNTTRDIHTYTHTRKESLRFREDERIHYIL